MSRLVSVAALTSALLLGGALTSGDLAFADPPAKPSASDIAYVRADLTKYGVPAKTQKTLLKAYAAGKTLDSDSSAAPISTKVIYVDGFKETIYRYKDGSVNVSKFQQPSEAAAGPTASLTGLNGCQAIPFPSGHKFVNCQVAFDGATYSVGYTAAITYLFLPEYGCSINSIAGLHYGGAGSFEDPSLVYITRVVPANYANYSVECRAQGTVVQHASGVATRTVGLLLHVSSEHGGWQTNITT